MSATEINKYIKPIASALRPQNRMERAYRLVFAYHTTLGIASSAIICFAYAQILGASAVNQYPIILIASAIFSTFINRVYAFLERRIRTGALMIGSIVFLSLLTLIVTYLYGNLGSIFKAIVLIVLAHVWIMLDDLTFWSLSDKAIDPSKEFNLFTINKNYKMYGKTIGFTTTLLLLPALQKNDSFLLWTCVWGGIAAIFLWFLLRDSILKRRVRKYHELVTKNTRRKNLPSFLNKMLHNSFAFKLGLMGFFVSILISFIEFVFLKESETLVSTSQSLYYIATLFASSYGLTSALYLVLGSKKLFQLGIRKLLVSLPLVFLLFITINFIILYTNSMINVWPLAMMVWFMIFYRSIIIIPSASSILHPFHRKFRSFLYTNIRGLFFTLGTAAAGILLLVLGANNDLATPPQLIGIMLITLLCWWLVSVMVSKDYKRVLKESVRLRNVESYELAAQDKDLKLLYTNKINSNNIADVIYALDALSVLKISNISEIFEQTLNHPSNEVKYFTLKKIKELNIQELAPKIISPMFQEGVSEQVKLESVRCISTIDPSSLTDTISLLDHQDAALRKGALISLLEHSSKEARKIASNRVKAMFESDDPSEVMQAIDVVNILALDEYHEDIKELMLTNNTDIRRQAIIAAGTLRHSTLLEPLIIAIKSGELLEEAIKSLSQYGNMALNRIEQELAFNYRKRYDYLLEFCKVVGLLKSNHAYDILWKMLDFPWKKMQIIAFKNLEESHFIPDNKIHFYQVIDHLEKLIKHFYWTNHARKVLEEDRRYQYLVNSIIDEIKLIESHILVLYNFLVKFTRTHTRDEIHSMLDHIQFYEDEDWEIEDEDDEEAEENEFEEEAVWSVLPVVMAEKLMIMKGYYTRDEKIQRLSYHYPKPMTDDVGVLINILQPARPNKGLFTEWTQAMALKSISEITSPTMLSSIGRFLTLDDFLLLEPALQQIENYCFTRELSISSVLDELVSPIRKDLLMSILNEETKPLMEIEKVLMLKATRLFSDLPEYLLTDVAAILKEERVKKGSVIFQQGDISDNMYIVYNGEIKVHEGTFTIDTMIDGDYFGDLGFLDSAPRLMTATAMRDSVLLKLEQADFYTLMSYRTDITQSIMQVLGQRIREQNRQIIQLKKRKKKR